MTRHPGKSKSSTSTQHKKNARTSSVAAPITVSARWIATALAIVAVAAALCVWAALCLIFTIGSWQLLYHPTANVARTPASAGIAFDPVAFDAAETGIPQLQGWWIPAPTARLTAIYLHGADGNLGDTIDALGRLHAAGLNVLAFDYRGYGQSQFVHPSEAHWKYDAESALLYLTGTRHLAANSIILAGNGLGANLALEVAAAHPELAGVILDRPLDAPTGAIFNDPRAHMVPAHLLNADRWDLYTPAASLRIPSLWFFQTQPNDRREQASSRVSSPKMIVWLNRDNQTRDYAAALSRWLDGLPQDKK